MELKAEAGRAQAEYARTLAWGTRIGLTLLVVSFVAYVAGLLPAHVPIADLPGHWSRPAAELLASTGTAAGWGWFAALPRSDMLVMAAIAFLSTCSIACLAFAMRAFIAEGARAPAVLCALEIVVILAAASGWFATGH
jgi:hypothetical protein